MGEKIHSLYTGKGDTGYTKDLLGARTGKESALIQLMSRIDSLQGAVDAAISESFGREKVILKRVQGKLWQTYPMIQDPENTQDYITNPINNADLHRIESYIWEAQKDVKKYEFIRFETHELQTLNNCRTMAREVEPSLHQYMKENKTNVNPVVPAYFNRLSSLFFAMAVKRGNSNTTERLSRGIRVLFREIFPQLF